VVAPASVPHSSARESPFSRITFRSAAAPSRKEDSVPARALRALGEYGWLYGCQAIAS
jgi:hypothetical protein